MPSTPRPKTFYAVRAFQADAHRYAPGDVVTGVALERVLPFGDRFVTTKKPAPPEEEKE